PRELEYAIAHQAGDMLLTLNPDLAKSYPIPLSKDVQKDQEHLKISPRNPSNRNYQGYMRDLLADVLAIHLTRDPTSLNTFHKKAEQGVVKEGPASHPSVELRSKVAFKVEEEINQAEIKSHRPPDVKVIERRPLRF